MSVRLVAQDTSAYKQSIFVNYGVQLNQFNKYIFKPFENFVQIGYTRELNKKWRFIGFFKTDQHYTGGGFTKDFRFRLNDSVTIMQSPVNRYLSNTYQIHIGASRKFGKYFSFGGNLLLGYSRRQLWVEFKADSYNVTDTLSTNCISCLESYLGDSYDSGLENQRYKVGHSNKLSLGTSLLFQFEYPLSKRFSAQLKYGMELYYNFDLGNTIKFSPKVDFYPDSYFRGSKYLTIGLNYQF